MTQTIKAEKDDDGHDLACVECVHHKDNTCGHYYSDHFGHMIAVYHPACVKFERRD